MLSLHVRELVYACCWMNWSFVLFHWIRIGWELVQSCGPTNYPLLEARNIYIYIYIYKALADYRDLILM